MVSRIAISTFMISSLSGAWNPRTVAHLDDDLCDGNHGRCALQNSPGIGEMKMLSFVKFMHGSANSVMTVPDPSRTQNFVQNQTVHKTSCAFLGAKMRLLACNEHFESLGGSELCPERFCGPKGRNQAVDCCRNIHDGGQWTPWSNHGCVCPPAHSCTVKASLVTSPSKLLSTECKSSWNEVPLPPSGQVETIVKHGN